MDSEALSEAPPIVGAALRSPGQPLDGPARAFFESRFGHDFSRVRIHTDRNAAESVNAVNAFAYATGYDIAFAAGEYAPRTSRGKRLLAHELSHVVQQAGGGAKGVLQRDDKPSSSTAKAETPCLTSTDCSKLIPGSSWDFAHKIQAEQQETGKSNELLKKEQEESKKQEAKQQPQPPPKQKEPEKKPPGKQDEPGKGGHVEVIEVGDVMLLDTEPPGPAVSLKKLMNERDKTLLEGVYDVVINPQIGLTAGAQVSHCELASPKPKDPNARCIDVPRSLEQEAAEFYRSDTIFGRGKYNWLTDALSKIRHEKAHIEFEKKSPVGEGHTFDKQKVFGYSPQIFRFELGEMNSILSELAMQYRRDDWPVLRKWLIGEIESPQEGLRGILKKLRCIATCDEVNEAVKKVVGGREGEWTPTLRKFFFDVVTDPSLKLDWPK
jgi:hypothetical protein